jgi:hypothetical protein
MYQGEVISGQKLKDNFDYLYDKLQIPDCKENEFLQHINNE